MYHYIKIAKVADGVIDLYTAFKMSGGVPYNRVVYFIEQSAQWSGKIQNDLRSYGIESRGKQVEVEVKGNNLICMLSYEGNFDADEAKEVLKELGIK